MKGSLRMSWSFPTGRRPSFEVQGGNSDGDAAVCRPWMQVDEFRMPYSSSAGCFVVESSMKASVGSVSSSKAVISTRTQRMHLVLLSKFVDTSQATRTEVGDKIHFDSHDHLDELVD